MNDEMDAKKLLDSSPKTGYIEVHIGDDGRLIITASGDTKDYLIFLRENGIELEEPTIEWCG